MVDQYIDAAVVSERFQRLRVVIERSGKAKHFARIGRVEEVVVEGPSKRDPEMTSGRTRQNKLIHFAAPKPMRMGTYAMIEVTDAFAHSLRGEFREIVALPTHRTRIPVVAL
jgi:tRNA-2-methylthio-N6-dimethylallyladenosine synthase